MIWKDSKRRAEEGREHVEAWVTHAVEQALANREVAPDMGETPALVRDQFSTYLRQAVPPDRVPSVHVDVKSTRDSMFQWDPPPWTHTATVVVGGTTVELLVTWDGKGATAMGASLVPK